MVKRFYLIMVFVLCAIPAMYMPCWGQGSSDESYAESAAKSEIDADEDMAAFDQSGYTTGVVMSVAPNTKTFTVKDDDTAQAERKIYVNDDTTFTGCSSISDVYPGDTVEVDYATLVSGMTVADNVVVVKRAYRDSSEKTGIAPVSKVLSD